MELRQVGTGYPSETSKANIIKEKMIFKSYNITNNNHFIMLFTDGDGSTSNPDVIIKPGITSNPDNDCSTELATNSRGRVICTYITTYSSANGVREQQQVVVKIKAKFFVVGSFIPSLKTIPIRGVGSSQIELTDAFQYQTVPTRTFSG
jgi:hypothetical protein